MSKTNANDGNGKYDGKKALVIAGCRPFHIGHDDLVKQVEHVKFNGLIWIVGEYENELNFRSPFYGRERKRMVEEMLSEHTIDSVVLGLADINDPPNYANYVIKELDKKGVAVNEKNTVIVSGNDYTNNCFTNYGHNFEVFSQKKRIGISATQVRTMMALDLPWRDYVPKKVQKIIDEINGEGRVKRLYKMEQATKNGKFKNPLPAVDIIIEYNDNGLTGIPLIERKNPPYGWALPGGFVEYGESIEDAGLREAKEETGLDIFDVTQFRWYSNPSRDSRQHIISHVLIAKARGETNANDAAEINRVRIFLINQLPEIMAFDHRQILDDYIRGRKK